MGWHPPLAQGVLRHGTDLRRIVISMDSETFADVREGAARNKCSFTAQARMLIEVGLETLKIEQAA